MPLDPSIKVDGEAVRHIALAPPFQSYDIYKIKLHGGPHDGYPAFAGNTEVVYMGGETYRINPADGRYYHVPAGPDTADES